ncbi:MAG: hypothetical protein AB8B60_19620 [Sulfitobacter sp.]
MRFDIPRSHLIAVTIGRAITPISQINPATFGIAAVSLVIFLIWKGRLGGWMTGAGINASVTDAVAKVILSPPVTLPAVFRKTALSVEPDLRGKMHRADTLPT